MAVEIKELVIRASIDYQGGDGKEKGAQKEGAAAAAGTPDQAALVEACVKQVLKILQQKKQR